MGKPIVVDGCQLEVVAPGTGDIEITSDPSETVLVGGNGVFFKEIKFKVSNSNGGGSVTNNDGKGEGSITATGENVLNSDGDKVVLLDDMSSSVVINGHSGDSPAAGAVVVKVSDAGQDKVIAL